MFTWTYIIVVDYKEANSYKLKHTKVGNCGL